MYILYPGISIILNVSWMSGEVLTSEKKFIRRSQSLLRDLNMVFISDWGNPHFLKRQKHVISSSRLL